MSAYPKSATFFRIGRWPAMYLALTLALAIIYRYGPSRKRPRWRRIVDAHQNILPTTRLDFGDNDRLAPAGAFFR
jgi:hypothetical protein